VAYSCSLIFGLPSRASLDYKLSLLGFSALSAFPLSCLMSIGIDSPDPLLRILCPLSFSYHAIPLFFGRSLPFFRVGLTSLRIRIATTVRPSLMAIICLLCAYFVHPLFNLPCGGGRPPRLFSPPSVPLHFSTVASSISHPWLFSFSSSFNSPFVGSHRFLPPARLPPTPHYCVTVRFFVRI